MKQLSIENGLLLTDLELSYNGKSLLLNRVLVDTGSECTIISSDLAETIGIYAEKTDMIYRICGVGGSEYVFTKTIDLLKIGEVVAENVQLEIGAMDYGLDLEGIIGLDLLKRLKAMINVDQLLIHFN